MAYLPGSFLFFWWFLIALLEGFLLVFGSLPTWLPTTYLVFVPSFLWFLVGLLGLFEDFIVVVSCFFGWFLVGSFIFF